MRAISVFSLEAGTSTLAWRAWIALRTRVSMSAMGSLVIVLLPKALARRRGDAEKNQKNLLRIFLRDSASPRQKHGFSLYQLAFTTPGISPFRASLRKHRRQTPNFLRYARGRPHRQQRLRCLHRRRGF